MHLPGLDRFSRRQFLTATVAASAAGWAAGRGLAQTPPAKARRAFTLSLAPGPIGLPDDAPQILGWAAEYGFESIEPSAKFLASASDAELAAYREQMRARGLSWGAANLPLQFRDGEDAFQQGMKALEGFARAHQRAGVTRVATWLSPGHAKLTYLENFRLHARRLREAAKVLGNCGLRLGLEYVGPKTSWSGSRYPFIHTMAEMKELIAEIGGSNVGFLLDSWHWYTAQEPEDDLLSLRAADVILCHVNDAPPGVPVEQQVDNRRGLPCSTGVINLQGFLGALCRIGYDGPVVCEPFSAELRSLSPAEVLGRVSAAMKQAAALVG